MSYKQNHHKKANLFCKVCYNKGDVKLSRTHNTCDERGKNCCPTLAAFTCKYCDASGHTQKFCTKKKLDAEREIRQNLKAKASLQKYRETLAKEAALQNTDEKEKENVSVKDKAKACASANAFAALLDESDDESDGEKTPEIAKVQKHEKKPQQDLQKDSAARAEFMRAWEPPKRKASASSRCWADAEDSDDDQEEEQKLEMSTARAAILGRWEPPIKSTAWQDVQHEELQEWLDARKRYGFEAVDRDERERLSYKDVAKK